ncbi:MAG: sulfatase-like hydrolase/transferase, partial [Bacteroidota bacterium]|nr:sulfatase-like hydrolase/transferase [Bacteroidota bacterium]
MKFKIYKTSANLFFLAFVLSLFNSCKNQEDEKNVPARPNIIFIMSDDHAYQALSCYDGSLNQTPNIDRLAEGGLIFTNSFVCNSICAPSRASLLTGKFSHNNGQFDNRVRFDSSQLTFPRLLQESGYETAIIGKWHLKSQPTGFDYWNVLPGQGHYYNPDFIRMGKRERIEGYVTDLITDFSLEWLDNRNKEKPFCLMVHHKAPHRTWMPDSTHFSLFKEEDFPLPSNYFDDYNGRMAAREQKMSIIEDMDLVYDLKMYDEEGEVPSTRREWYLPMLDRMNEG